MPVLARNVATTTASTTARPRPVAIRPTPALLPPCVSRPAGFSSIPLAPRAPPAPPLPSPALRLATGGILFHSLCRLGPAPAQGRVLAEIVAVVDLPRPADLLLGGLQHLLPLGQPPGGAGHGKEHREHLHRKPH